MVYWNCHFADLRAWSSAEKIDIAGFLLGETLIPWEVRFTVRTGNGGGQNPEFFTEKHIPDHERGNEGALDEELRRKPSKYGESRNADLQMLIEESEARNAPVDSV